MKKIVTIIIVLLMIFAFGCETIDTEDSTETISFRITWKAYSERGAAISKIVDVFNMEQSHYKIELIGGNEDLEEITSNLDDGNVDVFILPYRYVQLLGHQDKLSLLDTSKYVNKNMVSDKLLALGEVDNKTYGMPWVSHSMALLYNKSIINEAGIDINDITDRPTFLEALEKVETNTNAKGIGLVGADHNDLSWMINQFIYGDGGKLVDNNLVDMDYELCKKSILFYRDELGSYAQDTWLEDTGTEVMSYFRNQEVAFEIQGLWGITDIWRNDSPFEVGVISLKNIDANAEVGPMMLTYNKLLDENKKAVVDDFIAYMVSAEAQVAIMNGEFSPERNEFYPFRLPVREDILTSDSFKPYSIFNIFIESYNYPSIDVPTPKWMIIKEQIYTPYLNQVMNKEMTVDDFLIRLRDEGNLILKGDTNDGY